MVNDRHYQKCLEEICNGNHMKPLFKRVREQLIYGLTGILALANVSCGIGSKENSSYKTVIKAYPVVEITIPPGATIDSYLKGERAVDYYSKRYASEMIAACNLNNPAILNRDDFYYRKDDEVELKPGVKARFPDLNNDGYVFNVKGKKSGGHYEVVKVHK